MGLKKTYLVFIFFLVTLTINAQQKEGNIWYFGNGSGIDFNYSPPKLISTGTFYTSEGSAVISNSCGNLLFYTNGRDVYNRNHKLMPSVVPNNLPLRGNISSTQSSIIVQNPSDSKTYYLFTTDASVGLYYSIVDTTLDNGLGDIKAKNIFLIDSISEKLSAVAHKNGKDIWVLTHKRGNNSFYAYLINDSGVAKTPVISKSGSIFKTHSPGWLRFSPKGDKVVTADNKDKVEIFDFNTATGKVSNAQTLMNTGDISYGVEFSPSGKFLYISQPVPSKTIKQFDMSAGNIFAIRFSEVIIDASFFNASFALQLGPDGKIYVARPNSGYLGVINEPENKGAACNFVKNGFSLSSKKSSLGLPNFSQSILNKQKVGFICDTLKCGDLTVKLFNEGNVKSIIKSYWDFGDGTKDSGINVVKIYSNYSSYIVTNIVYTQANCKIIIDTLIKIIKPKPFPKAKFTHNADNQCLIENFYEFKDSSEFFLGTKFKGNRWVISSGSPVFNNLSIAKKFYKSGTYDVELIVESDDGCFDTLTKQITVKPSPTAKFRMLDSVQCYLDNEFIPLQQSSISGSNTITTYKWDYGDNTFDTLAKPLKKYSDSGTYLITLVVKADNNCRDTTYETVTVLPSPQVKFITSNICHQDTSRFQNLSITKTNTPLSLSYAWSFGDGNVSSIENPTNFYKDSGQYVTKLVITNNYDCKDSISKNIRVYPKPIADFEVVGNCEQHQIVLADKTQYFGSIPVNSFWNLDDGMNSTKKNAVVTYSVYGNKTIQLNVEDHNGCRDGVTKQHYINPLPQAGISVNKEEQCIKGNNFVISDATTIAEGNISQYQWLINGEKKSQNQNLSNQTFVQTGNQSLKLIVQSDSGCVDSISKIIQVYPNINLDVEIKKPTQCFKGHQYIISNNSKVNGAGSISKYSWIYSDNSTETTQIPKPKTFTSPGSYTLTAIMETDKGCLDTLTKSLIVWYSPQPSFDTEDICFGDSAYFDNSTPNKDSVDKWQWDFGDGTTSNTENPYRKYPATGNYEIKLIATTNRNCKDTTAKYYPNLVKPQPIAYFEDTLIDSYDRYTTIEFNNLSTGGTDYLWDFGDGTIETVEHPTKIYGDIGQFPISLTVSNQWGCDDIYEKKVFVVPTSYINIPTAFTPGNSDELNRYFRIEGIYYTKETDMKIFNRWGGLIYHSKEIAPKWDGKYKGELVADGVYLYAIRILDYKNKVHIYNGTVTVIK